MCECSLLDTSVATRSISDIQTVCRASFGPIHSLFFVAALAILFLVLGMAGVLPNELEAPNANSIVIFECKTGGFNDVCNNMCFGAKCAKWGSTFTWDKLQKPKSSQRARKAGCGSRNRRSKAPYGRGWECDEYPFRSVAEADRGGQVNRCVKSQYNNAQRVLLANFYYSRSKYSAAGCHQKSPCKFDICFKETNNIEWCSPSTKCKNDGNEYTKNGNYPDPENRTEDEKPRGGYYKLSSGDVIYSPGGTQIGAVALRTVPKNATLFDEYNTNHVFDPDQGYGQYDYMLQNLDLVEDVVVEAVDGP